MESREKDVAVEGSLTTNSAKLGSSNMIKLSDLGVNGTGGCYH